MPSQEYKNFSRHPHLKGVSIHVRVGDELVRRQLVMGRRGRFHIWGRHLGEVLINVTAINSKHRSYPLARFLARIFLLSTLQGLGITFTVNM